MSHSAHLESAIDQVVLLEGLIDQTNKSTAQTSAAIDKALTFVEASNRRIDEMERNRTAKTRHTQATSNSVG